MASASDHRAHAALQPADCLILLPQRLPAAVETSIGPAHYPAECTQSDAFLQPSLRARKGRANSNSFFAGLASLSYLPATVAPIGLTGEGLPVAVQIIGPEGEDPTTIEFARLLAAEIGGFVPPPAYA